MSKNVMIFGLGTVGSSILELLLREKLFRIDDILVADRNEKAFAYFDACGGKAENRIVFHMDSGHYTQLFDVLKKGDMFICLAEEVDSCALLEECCSRGIHFLTTADDSFSDRKVRFLSMEQAHFDHAMALRERYGNIETSVLQFGCNPGLISILTKKAVRDIVNEDTGKYVCANRARLQEMLDRGDWAGAAASLGIRCMIETDLDTTRTNIEEKNHTLYSTWNVRDFETETNRRALFKLGTGDTITEGLSRVHADPDQLYHYSKADGTLIVDRPGKETRMDAAGPDGLFEGCVIPHEELFSLYDFFSVRGTEGEINYAPTVMFVYRPCSLAMDTLFHAQNDCYELIRKEHVTEGGEAVGIVLTGDRFRSRYVYTILTALELVRDPARFETPTVFQVSASLLCAVKYILRHPLEGVLFPEYLDAEEVLSDVEKYLPIVSCEI